MSGIVGAHINTARFLRSLSQLLKPYMASGARYSKGVDERRELNR
jgi:hypothetical protein